MFGVCTFKPLYFKSLIFNIYGEQIGPVVTAFHSLSNSNGVVLSAFVSSKIIGFSFAFAAIAEPTFVNYL